MIELERYDRVLSSSMASNQVVPSGDLAALIEIARASKSLIEARRAYLNHLATGVLLDERDALQIELHHATEVMERLVRTHLLPAEGGEAKTHG